MTAARIKLVSVELYERPVTLRLPFRFGAATVTHCPQAFVRVHAEVHGRSVEGATAELMVPKWFDKNPGLSHEQNFEQLRQALRCAAQAYADVGAARTPWQLATEAGETAVAHAAAGGVPRLVAQFGTAQLDKAVADAALRAAGLPWVAGLRAGVLADPFSPTLALASPDTVVLRHTVGMADRLTAADEGADPGDGLPATLEAAISHYGLHHFKLKLAGRLDADMERLSRIAQLLDDCAGDYRVTLDGNETFASAAALGAFWQAITAHAPLARLLARTLLLEQPLPRAIALEESIASLGIGIPVILDESDDHADAFTRGLALGYRGISSKACKGIYRSLRNAARVAQAPDQLLLSGEDLTCQAGLAVQQDSVLASSLGVSHIERNGHHYVQGFGVAPASEADAFAATHPDVYVAGRHPHLAVREGRLQLGSLHRAAGFASGAMPAWPSLQRITP